MLHEARSEPVVEPLLPLSLAQRDVWHAQLLEPGSATYNIGGYVEIDGPVELAAFDRAIRRVVDEADSHNLLFVDTPIGVHQRMRPLYVEVPLIDVGRAEDPQAAAVAWMRGALLRPFDLVQGPLYRHALLKMADDRFAWFAAMHHLVTDAFGMLRFIRRLGDAYSTEVDSQPRPCEPATSWTEFLRDEVRYCESARYVRDRRFWREQLASFPEAVTLSGQPPGRPGQTIVSTGCIPSPVVARLEQVAARCDATLVALMLAATAAHLARLNGKCDIVLGMPVSGRTSGALRRVYGFVSNVVPLRLDVDPYASFTSLVRQAGVRAREAFRHQRYPAASLRRDLGLVPDAPSLYGTVINFLPEEVACRFGEHAGRLHMFTHASRVEDVLLTVHASGEAGMRLQFDANQARYDKSSLEHIQRSFLCLLESVARDPDGVTALVPIVSPAERRELLYGAAPEARPAPPRFLHELLESQTARRPDATALVWSADALSYGELNTQANRVAHHLIAAGVGPEVLVGLCVERSPAMIVGMLAISKAGGAYLPLDPTYPDARLRHMLTDAQPALIVGSERALGKWGHSLGSQLPRQLILDSDTGAIGNGAHALAVTNPTDLERLAPLRTANAAYVIYTSGSTGTPKGVVVTHAGLSALAAASVAHFRIEATSRVLQYSSINFDVSVSEVVMALGAGAALVLAPPEASSGAALRALLADQRISHLSLPAAVLPTLNAGADLALQCLTVGGEACAPGLIAAWSDTVRMINAYGPTESTVCATLSAPLQGAVVAPLGRAIEGTRVYVLDASLEPVPRGAQGELYIAGVGLARGYLGRPALTAERFVADPYGAPGGRMYRTGDVVLRRADGELEFVGRTDQQIKLRGFRVELGEVDCALNALAGVAQAVSVVREDVPGLRVLAAYVVPRSGHDVSAATLRGALAERLPAPMIPTQWVLLASLPLTANGKLDRHALPKPGEESLEASRYEAPRTLTEERLAAVWREILHSERIGRTDDFFELGGHSLIALQVIARVRDLFDLELPLQELFDARTLGALARSIDLAAAREHAPGLAAIKAKAASGPAPLSYSQERMWLIQSLNPQTTAYNMAAALRIRGHVDADHMIVCFDRLFERHEILRSSVRLHNELPTQVVESASKTRLQWVDLRGEQNPQAEAQRRAEKLARAPFDLGGEPVIRASLFQTGDAAYWLVIVLHHIAGDQWSMGVLGRELASLYNHRRSGLECSLPPLPVSYRDYSLWQRGAAFAAQFDQQLDFWRHKLADLPTVDLPTDHARPRVWTLHGTYLDRKIPPALFDKLQRFSRRSGMTLFMTSFAAFALLLQRITGQQDIPIGVPVANRTHSTLEGLVGTFVNTVVLRNDLSGDPTFDALLQRVRGTALEAFARQDVSFDRLVQEMGQRGDRSRAPLAQVLFNVTNAPMYGLSMDGLEWELVDLDRGGAQFELSVSLDTEIGRKVTVEYNTDLFERATIERWVGQYFTLLEAVADGSGRRISTLPLLPAEQWATLQAWNATQIGYPRRRLFPQLFEDQAARSPLRTAVTFEGAACSYGELNSHANRVARRLQALGVGPGELVAVCAERSPLLLVSLIGIQKSGAAYLPLDPDFPVERLRYMLADSGVKVVLTAGKLPPGLELPEGITALDVATAVSGAGEPDAADMGAVADVADVSGGATAADTAYVIYTSGSTGRPKGVAVSHGALLNFLHSMRGRPGLCADDVLAAVTTISFDIAALELYLPLLVGARIELISRRTATDGEALAGVLRTSGATLLQATPATWRMLLETSWSPAANFRALSGGEPLPRSLADSLLDRVGELWNLYGPTETTVWSTIEKIERGTAAISIGRPIANTQVHILDAHGQVVPIGVVGEICIGGAGVATGYHRRPALTAERFAPDPYSDVKGSRLYRTGDLGRWQDGRLYHCGRADFQVKIRGFRIELGEIEQVLSAHQAVRQAVVAVRDAQQDDSRLVAYVVYREGEEPTISDMKRHLRGELPDYMVPSIIMSLQSMPLTPNGKLDRAALPDPFASLQAPTESHDPPATAAERIVAEIWQSVLKLERVEAGDNFFELGGYSLLSLRVAKLLEKRTRYRMDPRALFFNNLRQIAALIDAEGPR